MSGFVIAVVIFLIISAVNRAAAQRRAAPPLPASPPNEPPAGPRSANAWAPAWYDDGEAAPAQQPEPDEPVSAFGAEMTSTMSALAAVPRAERQIGSVALESTLDSTIESSLFGRPSSSS